VCFDFLYNWCLKYFLFLKPCRLDLVTHGNYLVLYIMYVCMFVYTRINELEKHDVMLLLYMYVTRFVRAFAKLRKATISCIMSVRPHATPRLPLDGFSWNLIFQYFSKICLKNSSFVKIWQEQPILCMKTNIFFFYRIRLVIFRMKNVSGTSFKDKQNTHFMFVTFLFRKWCLLRGNGKI
jgi:hypothetical protein